MRTFYNKQDSGKIYIVGLEAVGLIDLEISDYYEPVPIYKSGKKIIELNSEGFITIMNEEQFFEMIEDLKDDYSYGNDYYAFLENNVLVLENFTGELKICVRDYRGNEYENYDLYSCIKCQDKNFDIVYIELPEDCEYLIPEFFIEDKEDIFDKVSSIKPSDDTIVYIIGDAHFVSDVEDVNIDDIENKKKILDRLKNKLRICVEEENYEEADKIKKQIDNIENGKGTA